MHKHFPDLLRGDFFDSHLRVVISFAWWGITALVLVGAINGKGFSRNSISEKLGRGVGRRCFDMKNRTW